MDPDVEEAFRDKIIKKAAAHIEEKRIKLEMAEAQRLAEAEARRVELRRRYVPSSSSHEQN